MNLEIALEEAKKGIREQAYYMKKALDASNIKEALKHGNFMLEQLRIGDIAPKDYYVLFMLAFDELMQLEQGFREEFKKGKKKMSDIYEVVQHASSIIPRLYLMITAGSVLIDSGEMSTSTVIKDIICYLKGVQHPFRGLFLRYYFLKIFKAKIPDGDDPDYQEKLQKEFGSLEAIIDILLDNLGEMNKLWIRCNSLIRDKKKRTAERNQLKITVGENIHRLSTIEGITLQIYTEKVLPSLLENITESKDWIAQQYLVDCIIHAFPDEYHIENLEQLLGVIENQNKKCDIKLIYILLMERFTEYSKTIEEEGAGETGENGEIKKTLSEMTFIWDMFKVSIGNIIEKSDGADLEKLLELQAAFINFSAHSYPTRIDYVNEILKLTVGLCAKVDSKSYSEEVLENIVGILTHPLQKMSIVVLNMPEYPNLMNYLPYSKRKRVAMSICEAIIASETYLINLEIVEKLIPFILPLLENEEEKPVASELESEQSIIAKLMLFVDSHDPNELLKMISMFEKYFVIGIAEKKKYTLPALIGKYTVLIHKVQDVNWIISQAQPQVADSAQGVQAPPVENCAKADGQAETNESPEQLENEVEAGGAQEKTNGDAQEASGDADLEEKPADETEGNAEVAEETAEAQPEEIPAEIPVEVAQQETTNASDNAIAQIEAKIREKYNLLDHSGYLSDSEKENFSFALAKVELDLIQVCEHLRTFVDEIGTSYPEIAIRLGLQVAMNLSVCDTAKEADELQYILCSDVLERYEDEISETRDKVYFLEQIIGALCNIRNMSEENMDIIIRNIRTYSSSFVRKRDSCLMILKASNLYCRTDYVDEEKIKECLRKALMFAKNACSKSKSNGVVYVHIQNKVMHYFDRSIETVGSDDINICIRVAKEHLENIREPETKAVMTAHLGATIKYLRGKKASDARYQPIEL